MRLNAYSGRYVKLVYRASDATQAQYYSMAILSSVCAISLCQLWQNAVHVHWPAFESGTHFCSSPQTRDATECITCERGSQFSQPQETKRKQVAQLLQRNRATLQKLFRNIVSKVVICNVYTVFIHYWMTFSDLEQTFYIYNKEHPRSSAMALFDR